MFGYDRRPEPDPRRDHGVTGAELLSAATWIVGRSWPGERVRIAFEQRDAALQVFRGERPDQNGREMLHAAVQVADLWAFETGRLP